MALHASVDGRKVSIRRTTSSHTSKDGPKLQPRTCAHSVEHLPGQWSCGGGRAAACEQHQPPPDLVASPADLQLVQQAHASCWLAVITVLHVQHADFSSIIKWLVALLPQQSFARLQSSGIFFA